jgi:hypothetical protein
VYSVSATVQLSNPLPNGDTVESYEEYCGDTIALATSGLWRLAPPGADGGYADWQPLDAACAEGGSCFESGLPLGADGDPGFKFGKLFHLPAASTVSGTGELYLFNRYGAVEKIVGAGASCR